MLLDTASYLVKRAGQKAGLAESSISKLLQADAEHRFEIKLGDKKLPAYRVQHSNKRGPYKGGIRFHEQVDIDEVRGLAMLMSLKTAAMGLPLGGGKGGVAVNPKQLSEAELEEISRKYVQKLQPHIGPDRDVPAPDVNTNAKIIDWMVDEYQKLTGDQSRASFTGKSVGRGGSLGRDAATGRGGARALAELLRLIGDDERSINVAVQGYGNVGSFFAAIGTKDHPNWQLVAASDSQATLFNENGLDAEALSDFKRAGGRFKAFESEAEKSGPESIIGLPVDVLVLAALEDAVTEDNAGQVKARYIVEMANGPVNQAAYEILEKQGKIILPDIIANAGGVVVSYLEWLQNKRGEHWPEDKVNRELEKYMTESTRQVVDTSRSDNVSLTEAAFILALRRLTGKEET
jgi:glutamate dehydrogenase/leucine dehydrogenase